MEDRVRLLNAAPVRTAARYVLYWAQMNRRVESNHALAFAAHLANQLDLPLLCYEGLTCSYPYASDRLHTFILEGVPDMAKGLKRIGAGYVFHLRRKHSDPDDALYQVAKDAAALVTDDYPTFIAARHNASVPAKIGIPYYAVDSSCVVPMNRHEKREYAAYTIRPKIRRMLPAYLKPAVLPALKHRFRLPVPGFHLEVARKDIPALAASCEIDHSAPPSLAYSGGAAQAEKHLRRFLEERLRRYARERNDPSAHATSDLSPYLHFGHIASLSVALEAREHARERHLVADEFLEELIVRRELAFNFARYSKRHGALEGNIPAWAIRSLREHARDPRPYLYRYEQFERAETHDALWNAAQKEMLLRGKIHGYYRMYWGKKIIEWSRTPEEALDTMIRLHDRWALDGRDPNTYTNILWCFGLHDRPWSERPVFGMVRYMSLEGMRRKTGVDAYLEEIAGLERTGKDPFRLE